MSPLTPAQVFTRVVKTAVSCQHWHIWDQVQLQGCPKSRHCQDPCQCFLVSLSSSKVAKLNYIVHCKSPCGQYFVALDPKFWPPDQSLLQCCCCCCCCKLLNLLSHCIQVKLPSCFACVICIFVAIVDNCRIVVLLLLNVSFVFVWKSAGGQSPRWEMACSTFPAVWSSCFLPFFILFIPFIL